MVLLGMGDAGAGRAYALLVAMSVGVVTLFTVPLLAESAALARLVSNDGAVQAYFGRIAWVLVPHCISRVCMLTLTSLLVPLRKGAVAVGATFVAFYVVAAPICLTLALTDVAPSLDVAARMALCVGATSIAQTPLALFALGYMACVVDWEAMRHLVRARANTDRLVAKAGASAAAAAATDETRADDAETRPAATGSVNG